MGLFSQKAPTVKFKRIGDEAEGLIVGFEKQQRTEFLKGGGIGEPMFWHKGKPTAGLAVDPATGDANRPVIDDVIVLDTGVPDEFGETERRLFIKGKQQLEALLAACKAVGVRDVDGGGRLRCRWAAGEGGTEDPRVYAYQYRPDGSPFDTAADDLQETLARKTASAAAAAERVANIPAAAKTAKATTKAALGIRDDDEPPF